MFTGKGVILTLILFNSFSNEEKNEKSGQEDRQKSDQEKGKKDSKKKSEIIVIKVETPLQILWWGAF